MTAAQRPSAAFLFRVALQFLTRLPVALPAAPSPEAVGASLRFYPLVGLVVGSLAGAVGVAAGLLGVPALPAAALAVAALVLLTGNLHLDGLMDTADGLGSGGTDREQVLAVMRDSRVGAHGVAAGTLALLLKVALLAGLPGTSLVAALALAAAWGRGAMVFAAVRYPYARPGGGLAHAHTTHAGRTEAAGAAVTLALATLLLAPATGHPAAGVAAAAGALPTLLLAGRWLARRLGGVTGDTLGALGELTEIAALAGLRAVTG